MPKNPVVQVERRLRSIDDAAQYASCDHKTIRRMIAAGELVGYRLGSKIIRVDLNELDACMRPIPTVHGRGAR